MSAIMSRLTRLLPWANRPSPKVRQNVRLNTPAYKDRHRGSDFLILATGPSLRQHRAAVQTFIDTRKPVTLAGNFMDGMFIPDYHAFLNRKRFCAYGKSIDPRSDALLSPYFTDDLIHVFHGRAYECISFEDQPARGQGEIQIENGIIISSGATIAIILIAVAIVMGAKDIYIAGMDGYSISDKTHHYAESDDKTRQDLLRQEALMTSQLASLAKLLRESSGGRLRIITPTAYSAYQETL